MMGNFSLRYSSTAAISASDSSPIIFRGNLCDSIGKSMAYGFQAVEIHVRCADEVNVGEIIECCAANNSRISTIGTGMSYVIDKLSLTDLDSLRRKTAIERLKGYIDMAALLNSGVIIGSMRGKVDYSNYEKHMSAYKDSILEVIDYAEYKKVYIYLEAINRYEINFHNTIEEMADFIESINSSKLKMLIDTFHMNIEESDMEDSIKKFGSCIGHVHFADNNRRHPGAGQFDFAKVINALKEIGFKGHVAFEYLPYPDSDTAAKNGLDYLLKL